MNWNSYRQFRQYRNDLNLFEYWSDAPPSATTDQGPYSAGDIVWNRSPGSTGTLGWLCTSGGVDGSTSTWTPIPVGPAQAAFVAAANTTGFTLTAAQISGGSNLASVDVQLQGTLGGAANVQLPTVASLVAALPAPGAGESYRLRITNASSANFAWTVTTNTGWTLTGTMSIAQNTWREFVLTVSSATAAVLQSVAVGTYS